MVFDFRFQISIRRMWFIQAFILWKFFQTSLLPAGTPHVSVIVFTDGGLKKSVIYILMFSKRRLSIPLVHLRPHAKTYFCGLTILLYRISIVSDLLGFRSSRPLLKISDNNAKREIYFSLLLTYPRRRTLSRIESRRLNTNTEWSLSDSAFRAVLQHFDPFEMDFLSLL